MKLILDAKLDCILFVTLVTSLFISPAWGGSYSFTPNSPKLEDLPHASYYAWSMRWDGPELGVLSGETIESAILKIDNINDWTMEFNDVLHIWMIDELPDLNWRRANWPGISVGRDDQGVSDAFANSGGVHLRDYTDENWWTEDLVIELPVDKLQEYISNDGMFGLAFDPDCHYYNDGISLIITTGLYGEFDNPVPEPVTGLGVLAGLSGLAGYLRKRKSA